MKKAVFFSVVMGLASFYVIGCGGNTSLRADDAAPDFTLKNENGENTTLSSYRGMKVVLFFYPKDETPGCIEESCAFRDYYALFLETGVEVLGVSVDDIDSHKKFKANYNLNFQLLSDSQKDVSERYGVLNVLGFSNRTTFLIDEEGIIKKIYKNVDESAHTEEVYRDVKSSEG